LPSFIGNVQPKPTALTVTMWKKPGSHVAIDPSQLVVGLFVWLDVRWDKHPFLANRMLLKTATDVALMQSLDIIGRLYYYPDKSAVSPPPLVEPELLSPEVLAIKAVEKTVLAQELRTLEQAKREKLKVQQAAAQQADQAWALAARSTRDALLNLTRSPKTAGEQLAVLSRETASSIAKGQEILLHLLGDKKEIGPQFHALNTMTLCMVVGKRAGLGEVALADLALAALAHDAGKAQIPLQILKTSRRKKHEEDFFRQHVLYSAQFAAQSGAFSREAIAIIADHHEAVDGSGWPRGKKDASIGARILAVVDRYDRLCTPEATDREPLMPAEALATMFRYESSKFDAGLLSLLIKLLGVYPPGTVVVLTDGSLAMVVSPGRQSLTPKVLIYSPELRKEMAPIVALDDEPDLKIAEAIRPATLPADARDWLSPQQRLSYFFSMNDRVS
jgi:HD-GYP domain-containing protein (c-di-GMP phosphodiesterase class II)